MFNKNLVMAIKAGGKVLREFNNSVYVPFGSEYTIFLKNLSTKRAKVLVSIDGEDALDGHSLILSPNENLELKRFIKNGNMSSGNAFKFIEKTAKVEKHRGNGEFDGLITVQYEFERELINIQGRAYTGTQYPDYYITDSSSRGFVDNKSIYTAYSCSVNNSYSFSDSEPQVLASTKNTLKSPQNTAGVTAPGSITEQKFVQASSFYGDGVRNTMTVQLEGLVEGQVEIHKPVTVTRLKRCGMCGTSVRQVAKFCHECGASVEIV